MKTALIRLFHRDLQRLKDEMKSYKTERNIWLTTSHISNSAGNLCLHLVGNLNHFIGAILGNSGYQRKREEEFSAKDVPLQELIEMIERTGEMLEKSLAALPENDFQALYPVNFNGQECHTDFVLIHLAGHLNYHLGQINYHRRLLDY